MCELKFPKNGWKKKKETRSKHPSLQGWDMLSMHETGEKLQQTLGNPRTSRISGEPEQADIRGKWIQSISMQETSHRWARSST